MATNAGPGGKLLYTAKHAFAGSAAQSQLTFQAGDRVVASGGQTGVWWWGNCNGKVS